MVIEVRAFSFSSLRKATPVHIGPSAVVASACLFWTVARVRLLDRSRRFGPLEQRWNMSRQALGRIDLSRAYQRIDLP
jgi:hypothetical protein